MNYFLDPFIGIPTTAMAMYGDAHSAIENGLMNTDEIGAAAILGQYAPRYSLPEKCPYD